MQGAVHGRPIVYLVSGVLDPIAASRWRAEIEEAAAPVVLDLSGASHVSDAALWVLLAEPRPRGLAVRGLTYHQERMLRYLHLDPSSVRRPGEAAAYGPGQGT